MGYKIIYFPVRGLGEHIRLLFVDQGISFEDAEVEREKWAEMKPTMQFGQVPCLVDDGAQIVQSNSIMRHLGRKLGLYGADEADATFADMVADAAHDLRMKYAKLIYQEHSEENKAAFAAGPLATELGNLERCIAGRNKDGFVLGDKLCYTDYILFELLDVLHTSFPGCMDDAPTLKGFHARVAARPHIAAYMATEKHRKKPINGNGLI